MKSKVCLMILFAISLSLRVFSQYTIKPSVDTIDQRLYNHAGNAPYDVAQDIDKLVSYLQQAAGNKKEIVKTFSYWIMQNISYDIEGFLNGVYNTNGVAGTLATKKGVCQDYSELFKAMCDRVGIPCYLIAGYAKAFDYKPGKKFEKANHSWNLIKLEDKYYLLDLTWSSGYVQYVDDNWHYYLKPDVSQLFTAPEIFVEKHLPADPQWQLLSHPVSMNAFMSYSNHQDMLANTSGYLNYADSIRQFEQLDKNSQDLKSTDNAFNFYPVLADYAYHYYNRAVDLGNNATDSYNAAVNSYNKSITDNGGNPVPQGDYNKNVINNAIEGYSKAIKLLSKISNYADNEINARDLLEKCQLGLDSSNELLKTLH